MKLLRGFSRSAREGGISFGQLEQNPSNIFALGSVATIGAFDGLHLGHQAVLSHLVKIAKARSLPSVVLTLEPLPREFFSPDLAPPRLMRFREKFEVLCALGIDYLLVLRFNEHLRNTGAEEFAREIFVDALNCRHLVIGDDFRFGREGSGDFNLLSEQGKIKGFVVESTATLAVGGERVSSTRIRQLLQQGAFAQAERLLGRPYTISGRVVYGRQLGRTINVPTANIQLGRIKAAMAGVYAVTAKILDSEDGRALPAVANLGARPTVNDGVEATLEVHILDFSQDIYGKRLAIRFRKKIREEQKFESFELLREQIFKDIDCTRDYFEQDANTL